MKVMNLQIQEGQFSKQDKLRDPHQDTLHTTKLPKAKEKENLECTKREMTCHVQEILSKINS